MSTLKLIIKNLSVAYNNNQILHHINLSATSGQVIGLLGGSGNGKTTLLNTLACALPVNAAATGSINWNGTELLGKPLHEQLRGRHITMLPQQTVDTLFPLHTIRQHFYILRQVKNYKEKEETARLAVELLSALHCDNPQHILDSYPFQLSGGMKQRVCLALCLLLKPKLFLADEPASGLDVIAQNELLQQLHVFRERSNASIIITSHNPAFLYQIADNIIVLQQGRIVESGPAGKICLQPQAEYTRQLLAAAAQNIPGGVY